MKERRSSYRVEQRADGLRAVFELHGESWEGVVADTSVGGVAVSYPLDAAPTLALGDCLSIVFLGAGIEPGRHTLVWVRSSVDTGIHRRFGFSFTDPSRGPEGVAVQSVEQFNRRAWLRVVPDRRIMAVLTPMDGCSKDVDFQVAVADLSAGGVAVLVAGVPPERFRDVTAVRCVVTFPGESEVRTIVGQVCGREHLTQCLRLGISFARGDESAPIYEKSWDCTDCGSRQLLAETHIHCPACSCPRGAGARYLLPWSVIAPVQAHLYYGDDKRCVICKADHAASASFCGRCGASLR